MILNRSSTDNNTMGRRNLSQGFGTLRIRIFDEMPLHIPRQCEESENERTKSGSPINTRVYKGTRRKDQTTLLAPRLALNR